MNSTIYTVFLIIILYFAKNVMMYLGIPSRNIYFIYALLAVIFICIEKGCLARNYKSVKILITVSVIIAFIKMQFEKSGDARTFALLLTCPTLIIGCLPTFNKRPKFWSNSYKVILIFYIIECAFSIFERFMKQNIFPWYNDNTDTLALGFFDDISEFRSFGLMGHPLQNALTVCTIMTFILCSKKIKGNNKLILWALGFASLLCFNTRASIVGAILILIAYVGKEYFSNRKISFGKRNLYIIGLVFLAFVSYDFIIQHNLGGRLMSMGLFDDESAQVRVNTWDLFDYFSPLSFLFGMDENQRAIILNSAGLILTENFWIDYMFSIGLIGLTILLLSYILTIKTLYKGYNKFDVFLTSSSFILIASTNNSLSDTWVPIFIYMILICIFSYKERIKQ